MRKKQRLINYEKNLNRDICFSLNLIKNDTKEIRDYLSHTQKKLANIDSKLKHSKEWKQIALVLDRFLFFLWKFFKLRNHYFDSLMTISHALSKSSSK